MKAGTRLLMILVFTLTLVMQTSAGGFGEPSNSCGIWKKQFSAGLHLISFPLLPENTQIDSVIGNQLPGGASAENACQLFTINNGEYISSYFSSTSNRWIGDVDTIHYSTAYWLEIPSQHDMIEITLVGAAMDIDSTIIGEYDETGIFMVASPSVFTISLANAGLTSSGMSANTLLPRADRILNWNEDSLLPSWNNGSIWDGQPFNIEPWKGYLLEIGPNNSGFTWIYETPDNILDIPIIRNDSSYGSRFLNFKINRKAEKSVGGLE